MTERISCSTCAAVCCRFVVCLMPGDKVPEHMVEPAPEGRQVMRRGVDGWCVAVDRLTLRCTIYSQRPRVCRQFAEGGRRCRQARAAYAELSRRV